MPTHAYIFGINLEPKLVKNSRWIWVRPRTIRKLLLLAIRQAARIWNPPKLFKLPSSSIDCVRESLAQTPRSFFECHCRGRLTTFLTPHQNICWRARCTCSVTACCTFLAGISYETRENTKLYKISLAHGGVERHGGSLAPSLPLAWPFLSSNTNMASSLQLIDGCKRDVYRFLPMKPLELVLTIPHMIVTTRDGEWLRPRRGERRRSDKNISVKALGTSTAGLASTQFQRMVGIWTQSWPSISFCEDY